MKIFVNLLNEGVNVWRPVEAVKHKCFYRLISYNKNDDEEWEFNFNDLVICKKHKFSDGNKGYIAIEKANEIAF